MQHIAHLEKVNSNHGEKPQADDVHGKIIITTVCLYNGLEFTEFNLKRFVLEIWTSSGPEMGKMCARQRGTFNPFLGTKQLLWRLLSL